MVIRSYTVEFNDVNGSDPLRRQPVQRPEDGVLQRVAAHDRVVQGHLFISTCRDMKLNETLDNE